MAGYESSHVVAAKRARAEVRRNFVSRGMHPTRIVNFPDRKTAELMKTILDRTAFPTSNILSIEYAPYYSVRIPGTNAVRKASAYFDFNARKITILASFYDMHIYDQIQTIVHEAAHSNSPQAYYNDTAYGGYTNRLQANAWLQQVAKQFLNADIFLNPYHRECAVKFRRGDRDMPWESYAEETFAILLQARVVNRDWVLKIQKRVKTALGGLTVPIISGPRDKIASGVDGVLSLLYYQQGRPLKDVVAIAG